MAEPTVKVRVSVDGSGAAAGVAKANEAVGKFGPAVERSVGQATNAVKEHERAWGSAGSGIQSSLVKIAGLIAGAFSVAKLREWTNAALEGAERIANLSQSLGVSTQNLQAFDHIARINGSTLDNVAVVLARLSRATVEARDKTGQSAEAFRALGVDILDANGKIKSADVLIVEIGKHMSTFAADQVKTAAVLQLMGRGAAEAIPFFNALGREFDALKKRGEDLGVVLKDRDMAALLVAHENVELLEEAARGLTNQLALALAPAINAVDQALVEMGSSGATRNFFTNLRTDISQAVVVAGEMIGVYRGWMTASNVASISMHNDLVSYVQFVKDTTDRIANFFTKLFAALPALAAIAWNEIKAMGLNAAGVLADAWGLIFTALPGGGPTAQYLGALADSLHATAAGMREMTVDTTALMAQMKGYDDALAKSILENQKWADGTRITAGAFVNLSSEIDGFVSSLQKGDIAGNAAKYQSMAFMLRNEADAMIASGGAAAKVNADLSTVLGVLAQAVQRADAAQMKYDANALAGQKAADKRKEDTAEMAKFLDQLSTSFTALDKAGQQWNLTQDEIKKRSDQYLADGKSMVEVEKWKSDALKLAAIRFQEVADAGRTFEKVQQDLNDQYAKENQLLTLTGRALQVENEYQRLLMETDRAMAGVMGPLTEQQQRYIETLHDTAAAHVDAANAANQAIEIERLWQSAVTSGLYSLADTLSNFAVGGFRTMHDFWQALLNDAKQFIAAIIAQILKLTVFNGIINSMFGLTGKDALLTGLGKGWLGQLFGGAGATAADTIMGGGGGGFEATGITGVFNTIKSGFSSVWDSLVNTTSLVDKFGNAAGSWLGALGAVFAGFTAGSQMFGTAGGIALGAIAAIYPVVGWIAGGLSLINSFTGGKLFGTGWKNTGNYATMVDIGPTGAFPSATVNQKKEGALFSGASWREKSVAVDQATIDNINKFWDGIKAMVDQGARMLESSGEVISGHFIQTFDKNGKVVIQESTVLGKKYTETLEEFGKRITAESLLTLIPGASEVAEQWRKSATDLLAGVQFLLQAQFDIKHGHALIQDASLADLTAFVQSMVEQDETLMDAYVRLSAELTTVSNILKALKIDTGLVGVELAKYDDALVKAAGSLDNLVSLSEAFYKDYTSAEQQKTDTVMNLQDVVTTSFARIGQDPTMSMEQFAEAFNKIKNTLSPEDLVAWMQAGVALYNFDYALGITTQQLKDSADAFAKAQTDAIAQGAAAYAKLQKETRDLAGKLFGTQVDQLKARRAAFGTSIEGFAFTQELDRQIAAAEAQALAAENLADATQLMANLGQIGVVSGQSLDDIAKQFAIPLDKFAQFLGTDQAGLQAQYLKSEELARAALDTAHNTEYTNQLLADILAAYLGQPLPYSIADLQRADLGITPVAASNVPGKGVGRAGVGLAEPGSSEVAVAVDSNTRTLDVRLTEVAAELARVAAALSGIKTTMDRRGLAVPVNGINVRVPA